MSLYLASPNYGIFLSSGLSCFLEIIPSSGSRDTKKETAQPLASSSTLFRCRFRQTAEMDVPMGVQDPETVTAFQIHEGDGINQPACPFHPRESLAEAEPTFCLQVIKELHGRGCHQLLPRYPPRSTSGEAKKKWLVALFHFILGHDHAKSHFQLLPPLYSPFKRNTLGLSIAAH